MNLSRMTSEYVGRIAVAVWIGRLSEEAAHEALGAYAAACRNSSDAGLEGVHRAILSEYRQRRAGHDLCS